MNGPPTEADGPQPNTVAAKQTRGEPMSNLAPEGPAVDQPLPDMPTPEIDAEEPTGPRSLAEALVWLQAEMPTALKTAEAQYGKYADLAGVSDALLPRMASLGLAFTCRPTLDDGQFVLLYSLVFPATAEHWDGIYPLRSTKPQEVGAEITYARRYALQALTGLAPKSDDDDAQALTARAQRDEDAEAAKRDAEEEAEYLELDAAVAAAEDLDTLQGVWVKITATPMRTDRRNLLRDATNKRKAELESKR